jgi:hypothetical protein
MIMEKTFIVTLRISASDESIERVDSGAGSIEEHISNELGWAAQSMDSMDIISMKEEGE